MHKFTITILIAIASACVLSGCGGGSSSPTGSISGTVTTVGVLNPDSGSYGLDVPVAGATVTVEGTSSTATTDANGSFTISGLGAGTYYLVITKPDYLQLRQQVTAPRSSLTLRISKDTGTRPDPPGF